MEYSLLLEKPISYQKIQGMAVRARNLTYTNTCQDAIPRVKLVTPPWVVINQLLSAINRGIQRKKN